MLNQKTIETLKRMHLPGMADAFITQLKDPNVRELSFEERFGLIVDYEWTARENRKLSRLIKEAGFKMPACMEDLDYHHHRGLDRSVMSAFLSCAWLEDRQNITICGPTGIGKTYICSALGNLACRNGYSVRYHRVPKLLSDIHISKGDGSYPSLMKRLSRTDLLILDDWGIGPMTAQEARDILEVIEDRYQLRSTIISSQLPVDQWHELIADPTVADAILDRLLHNAHAISLKGESMRKLLAKRNKTVELSQEGKG